MTVAELAEKLSALPQGATVFIEPRGEHLRDPDPHITPVVMREERETGQPVVML